MHTVRFRITAIATAAVVVVLAVTGLGLIRAQQRLLTASIDTALRQRADALTPFAIDGTIASIAASDTGDESLLQLTTPQGQVVVASRLIGAERQLADASGVGRDDLLQTRVIAGVDDDAFRLLSRRIDNGLVLTVATAMDDVFESADALATSLLVAVPLAALLLAGLTWYLVGRTLRPVEAIRAVADSIEGTDLGRRVPDLRGDDEIARLAHTMNQMLDRVERATGRQQRFVADASHELRSPLARMRSEIEVDLAHPERADPLATHRSVLEEATGLQRLVDDLLYLARADAATYPRRHHVIDLDDIVLKVAGQFRTSGRMVDCSGVSAAQIHGDAAQLTRAVGNLVDNAVRYARSSVTLTLAEHDHTATLTITDDGPGIPPDRHAEVFERFSRLDSARHRATGGAGLGLAITRDIVERHGGTITIDPDHNPGTRFVITIPSKSSGHR